jgi:hypothetical protein
MDLALLYNLFLDAENIIEEFARQGSPHHSENVQSLGRSVILACGTLLESFASGIGAAYVMDNPGAPSDILTQLRALPRERLSLNRRLARVIMLTAGEPPPKEWGEREFEERFKDFTLRRNSIVHCEPDIEDSADTGLKQRYLHDIDLETVSDAVDLVCEAICTGWRAVYKREGPKWLPGRNETGRFRRVSVKLAPKDDS